MRFKGTIGLLAVCLAFGLYYLLVDTPREEKKAEEKERSEKILLFESNDAYEIVIATKDQTIVLKRNEKENWDITEPLHVQADNDTTQGLLADLEDARFSRVVEENPPDLAVFGLNEPSLKVTLKLKEQGEKLILFGDDAPVGSSLYIKRGDQSKVLLSSVSRSQWDKSLYDLRDKTILDFNPGDISKIEIQRGKKILQLIRDGEKWELQSGSFVRKGDSLEIENLLNTIRQAKVMAFVEENPKDLKEYGLNNPSFILTLTTNAGEPAQSLLIGFLKEKKHYLAKTNQAENVIGLDQSIIDLLSQKALYFLDKTLLAFNEDEATELRFHSRDGEILISRDESGDPWKIEKPIQAPTDPAVVAAVLSEIKNIKFIDIVKNPAAGSNLQGLTPPRRKLTVVAGDNPPLSLQIGNRTLDGKLFFIRKPEADTVYMVESKIIDNIFLSFQGLSKRERLDFKKENVIKIRVQAPNQTFEVYRKGEEWRLEKPEKSPVKQFSINKILEKLDELKFGPLIDTTVGPKAAGLNPPNLTVTIFNKWGFEMATVLIGNPVKNKRQYYARIKDDSTIYQIPGDLMNFIPKDWKSLKPRS